MTNKRIHNYFLFAIFVIPSLLFVLFSTDIPFVMNLFYSLFNWNGIARHMNFVGFDNFRKIFTTDKIFWSASRFTLKFTVYYVIFVNILSLFVAEVLHNDTTISKVGRVFYFVPYIISLTAIGLIWQFILGPGFDSLWNMTSLPFFGLSWLGETNLAFIVVVFISIWQNIGFYMINYIAGLISVPKELLEAATIDGASPIQRFFKITIPLIMPAISICLMTSLTFAFKLFDIILVFTKGGPAGSTTTVAYNIYQEAFLRNHYGLATAKSLIFVIFVLIVTYVQLKITKSKEVEA
jgi:raffinose/stachyose/melibiose transport system permease protein